MACGPGSAVVVGGLSFFRILTYPIHFSFYALVISAIAMVAVSVATKPTEKKILDETLSGWFIQPRKPFFLGIRIFTTNCVGMS